MIVSYRVWVLMLTIGLLMGACAPTAPQVVPTERPTITPTFTPTATRTRAPRDASPTPTLTQAPASPTGGPSPTSLLGATATPNRAVTSTPVRSANAPRIEFFTSDVQAVAPGSSVSLFWSTRGATGATIYRLDPSGARNQLWNVPPDGNLTVSTRQSDRGTVDFLIAVGDGPDRIEQGLSLPLSCPVSWFFSPPPADCPNAEPIETAIIEQPFQRGRMLYVESSDEIYALFNDGFDPAWVAFQNRYNPVIHAESEPNFAPPPGLLQPLRILGFVWRGNDRTRSRLGLATQQEFAYDGFVQTSPARGGDGNNLYISSSDGTVVQLLPAGESWQLITLPTG